MKKEILLFSCEHGGNRVPKQYRKSFQGSAKVLKTHRGLDIGALEIAKKISKALRAPLISSQLTRLLIDLNRSLHHKGLFSQFTKEFSDAEKLELIENFYLPHRQSVEKHLSRKNHVLHLAIHSFTPELFGKIRNADIGLLYDPQSKREREVARELKRALENDFKVRMNYPYLGTSDGLPTSLRKKFKNYAGLEIEINQKFFLTKSKDQQKKLAQQLCSAIQSLKRHKT